MLFLRTLLLLSRGTGLPTVWSHCFAGWWLGGGGRLHLLPWLLAGISLIYLGGTFTNDVLDLPFDREHRRARPIPSGSLSAQAVWRLGWTWFALGAGCLFWISIPTGVFGLLIITWGLTYNATHRYLTLSPALLGLCRFLVYLTAASSAQFGVTGWCLWSAVALAVYYIGAESVTEPQPKGQSPPWPAAILLACPMLLALIVNNGDYRQGAIVLLIILAVWIAHSLRPLLRGEAACESPRATPFSSLSTQPDPGIPDRYSLFPGLVFVDWLAVVDCPPWLSGTFISLFFTALLFQRLATSAAPAHAPATSR